jgi:hypothetical protein
MARQPEQSEKDDQRRDEQHQNPVVQHSRPLQLLSGRGSETHHALGETLPVLNLFANPLFDDESESYLPVVLNADGSFNSQANPAPSRSESTLRNPNPSIQKEVDPPSTDDLRPWGAPLTKRTASC